MYQQVKESTNMQQQNLIILSIWALAHLSFTKSAPCFWFEHKGQQTGLMDVITLLSHGIY